MLVLSHSRQFFNFNPFEVSLNEESVQTKSVEYVTRLSPHVSAHEDDSVTDSEYAGFENTKQIKANTANNLDRELLGIVIVLLMRIWQRPREPADPREEAGAGKGAISHHIRSTTECIPHWGHGHE